MKDELKKQADRTVKLSQLRDLAYVIAKYNMLIFGYYTFVEDDKKVFVEEDC